MYASIYQRNFIDPDLTTSSLTYAQQTYYISTSGSDSNNGTSESKPWKSISKVNSFSFKPGDRILFKRGGRWNQEILPRSSGSAGNLITIGAYGSGNKPIISPNSGSYAINIRIKSYYRIENLHVITPPNGSGIALRGDSEVAKFGPVMLRETDQIILGRALLSQPWWMENTAH